MIRVPVLMYHHIGPPVPGALAWLTVPPQAFKRQMEWLHARGYTGIRPSDLLAARQNGHPLPERPIIITFDDGFHDLCEYAFPVLQDVGFAGAAFVVTSHLGDCWNPGGGTAGFATMTATEVAHWAKQIEFGSHTHTHPDLRALSPAELESELRSSRERLSAIVGGEVISIAYPYGATTLQVRAEAAKYYKLGFSVARGVNGHNTDLLALRRNRVLADEKGLWWRTRFGFNPCDSVRYRVQRWTSRSLPS